MPAHPARVVQLGRRAMRWPNFVSSCQKACAEFTYSIWTGAERKGGAAALAASLLWETCCWRRPQIRSSAFSELGTTLRGYARFACLVMSLVFEAEPAGRRAEDAAAVAVLLFGILWLRLRLRRGVGLELVICVPRAFC